MRAKTARLRRPGRDYPTIAAIMAILLSVAVLVGIVSKMPPGGLASDGWPGSAGSVTVTAGSDGFMPRPPGCTPG